MTDLNDLYQELIVDHSRRPRNCRALEAADHSAEGFNPLCGDRVTLRLKLKDDVIEDIAFQGAGCAISTASVSLLTEALKGRTVAEAGELFKRFQALVTGTGGSNGGADLGKLRVFGGVSRYPARVKCAILPWHTLKAALDNKTGEVVSTE